ncbi:phosphotransferase family protein [Actinomadura mexicana]|uniref:Predicted kinase, aminoglycoside phosphotransferase (APT) family n=1 Tax=Actinomadura mexicana TaxID=134959 RepID=A0A239C109_9ACTN|nr:phosphotransferase family protein [Actinomadura mexicana]SNS13348.1 Predicted kinase, aminoglycoside phosphotransferase (APT) family [Actinomadura mexicana]
MTAPPPPLADHVPRDVADWLRAGLPEADPPFAFDRITGGYSMLTYRMTDRAGHAWALRHAPAGHSGGRAHDAAREARAMAALRDTVVPVPRVRMTGGAADPLGVPCHVTDFVEGFVLDRAEQARRVLTAAGLRRASIEIVSVLAELHAVNPDAVGLGDLGPRADYNGRQLRRFRAVLADLEALDSPLDGGRTARLDRLGAELADRLPRDAGGRIVHGDYRLGNAIIGADGSVRAVLDWELVTLGEPLADLGMLLNYWNPPPGAMLGVTVPTAAPGSVTEEEAIAVYARTSQADLGHLNLYRSLAAWRLACLCLRTAMRFGSGAMDDGEDPRRFASTTDHWTDLARSHFDQT